VKIGTIDMFFSLLASRFNKSFKDNILRFHYRTSKTTRVSLRTPIRVLAAILNQSQTIFRATRLRKSIDTLSEDPSQTKSAWSATKKALKETYSLLSERGFVDLSFLPQEPSLTPFAYYLHLQGNRISKIDADRLFYWLLMASYHGRYSRTVHDRLNEDVEILRSGKGINGILRSLRKSASSLVVSSSDFDNRQSKHLIMLMLAAERNNGALDWFGGRLVSSEKAHAHHIFPKKYLKDNGITTSKKVNHICNITLVSSTANLDISSKAPRDYFLSAGIDESKLESHFIPLDEDLWDAQKYDKFLKKRKKLLSKGVKDFLQELKH
jgi:hypothetical protein